MLCMSLSTPCRGTPGLPARASAAATAAFVASSCFSKCRITLLLTLLPPALLQSGAFSPACCCLRSGNAVLMLLRGGARCRPVGEGARQSCPDTTISSASAPCCAAASWCWPDCSRLSDCCSMLPDKPCTEMRKLLSVPGRAAELLPQWVQPGPFSAPSAASTLLLLLLLRLGACPAVLAWRPARVQQAAMTSRLMVCTAERIHSRTHYNQV